MKLAKSRRPALTACVLALLQAAGAAPPLAHHALVRGAGL